MIFLHPLWKSKTWKRKRRREGECTGKELPFTCCVCSLRVCDMFYRHTVVVKQDVFWQVIFKNRVCVAAKIGKTLDESLNSAPLQPRLTHGEPPLSCQQCGYSHLSIRAVMKWLTCQSFVFWFVHSCCDFCIWFDFSWPWWTKAFLLTSEWYHRVKGPLCKTGDFWVVKKATDALGCWPTYNPKASVFDKLALSLKNQLYY